MLAVPIKEFWGPEDQQLLCKLCSPSHMGPATPLDQIRTKPKIFGCLAHLLELQDTNQACPNQQAKPAFLLTSTTNPEMSHNQWGSKSCG